MKDRVSEDGRDAMQASFDCAGVGIAHITAQGNWLRWNPRCGAVFGRPLATVERDIEFVLYPVETHAVIHRQRQQALDRPGETLCVERRYSHGDGTDRWLEVTLSAAPSFDPPFVVEVYRDITQRKDFEAVLTAREALHLALLRTAVDAIITTDAFGSIASINPAGERMFGYSSEELVGKNISIIMPQPHRQDHDSYMRRYRETGVSRIIGIGREVVAQRRDGRTFPIDLSVSEVKSGTSHFFKGIIRDLTERKRLESQILEISDREQKRIGQDLHDGLGQQLTGIGFLARSLQSRLTEVGHPEAGTARQLADLVGQSVAHTRALARGLHPVAPVPGGLNSALVELTERMESTYGVKCRVSCDDLLWFKDPTIPTHIYRIIQEAANNAIKHARPQNIDIVLAEHRQNLHVTIEDDGTGFPEQMPEKPGMGLQIMKSRAGMIGAKITFSRRQPCGTTLHFAVPYESQEPA